MCQCMEYTHVCIMYAYNVPWIAVFEFKALFILLYSKLGYNERRVTANFVCHHVNIMCVTMHKITVRISKWQV